MKALIHQILVDSGVAKGKIEALTDQLLAVMPKSGESHPPKTENGVTYIWCSRHQEYHPSDIMVPNKSKESGYANYCKPAQRKWEWMHKHSNLLGSVCSRLYSEEKNKSAKLVWNLAQTLKNTKNAHSTFNNISVSDSIDEVVQKCISEFYTPDIISCIPEDMHKMLGLAKSK